MVYGFSVIALSAILLITGLVLLWIGVGFFGAIIGALVYFLLLPLVFMPLLTALNLIPVRYESNSTIAVDQTVPVNANTPSTLDDGTMPTAEDFRREIHRMMLEAQNAGKELVLINAGQLHRGVGGYPGTNHRMPNCCQVMRAQMLDSADFVLDAPPSGVGASLTIGYHLPRLDWG